jgi:RNA polymerase sigma-70 factor (ECF subfamily)
MPAPRGLSNVDHSDGALVRRVLAGETDAFAGLVARHRDRCARFAVHMLGNREDAEDAMQEAFLRAFRALRRCEDPEQFGSWLFRILVNRCRTIAARRGRRQRTIVFDDEAVERASVAHPEDRDAWREEIAQALARIDPLQREAFLLRYVEDLGYEEMSRLTGTGISALKMRAKRACDRLRDLLAEVYHA